MANEVFANDLEIACKAADGKSIACFPDVCFTPPSPPAGWIPIPYANTAYAKDTANASKTVFISGKPIMKKDVSYFKTSTGNEPAAGPKGIVSGVKKGKAFFTSWSMNVKIEGKNVDRHTDLTTHNHGSSPNTGPWYYADTKTAKKECKGTIKKVQNACKTNKKKKRKGAKKTRTKREDPKLWRDRHCDKLDDFIKERKKKRDKYRDKRQTIESQKKQVTKSRDDIKKHKAAATKLRNKIAKNKKAAKNSKARKVGKVARKHKLVDVILTVGEFAVDVLSKPDNSWTPEMHDRAVEMNKKYIEDTKRKRKTAERQAKKLKDDVEAVVNKIVTAALDNKCLTARKCILFPCGENDSACCKSQTPHHLVPNAMIQNTRGKPLTNELGCLGYEMDDAPCMCVEGFSQYVGSHKLMHTNTTTYMKNAVQSNGVSISKAKESALLAHRKTFPGPKCKKKCLEKQLDAYFNKKGICRKNAILRAVDHDGNMLKPITPKTTKRKST